MRPFNRKGIKLLPRIMIASIPICRQDKRTSRWPIQLHVGNPKEGEEKALYLDGERTLFARAVHSSSHGSRRNGIPCEAFISFRGRRAKMREAEKIRIPLNHCSNRSTFVMRFDKNSLSLLFSSAYVEALVHKRASSPFRLEISTFSPGAENLESVGMKIPFAKHFKMRQRIFGGAKLVAKWESRAENSFHSNHNDTMNIANEFEDCRMAERTCARNIRTATMKMQIIFLAARFSLGSFIFVCFSSPIHFSCFMRTYASEQSNKYLPENRESTNMFVLGNLFSFLFPSFSRLPLFASCDLI